jgi:hypothetical protein
MAANDPERPGPGGEHEREPDGGPEGPEGDRPEGDRPEGDGAAAHHGRFGAAFERDVAPAWRRVTMGEPRLASSLAVLLAIGLQLTLPESVSSRPRWLLPGISAVLLMALAASNPYRFTRTSPAVRIGSLVLIAALSLANAWSAVRLVDHLVTGTDQGSPTRLLLTGGSIWLTNVVTFGLWYWELDRGGPVARARAVRAHPDFLFPQMQSPEVAPAHWAPHFVDYAYLSFTNATAFSPTDVMPLTRWAKLTMMLQSAVSRVVVALVVARAVNILR